jgi:hypothetical protein
MVLLQITRQLDNETIKMLKSWARSNYRPGKSIPRSWHSIVRQECKLIDREYHARAKVSTKDMG